jgi:peptide/nickel transport system substrate-binding protein
MGPETGGTLRVPTTLNLSTLNGMMAFEGPQYIASIALNGFLTQPTPERDLRPELATEWESNSEGTEWTFQLRDDAVWHHSGNRVIAEDVAATANEMYAEDSQARGKGTLGPLENAEVVNDHAVTLTFSEADGQIPLKWGSLAAPIYPKNVVESRWEEMSQTDFGCGPFELESYQSDGTSRFTAFDDYFMKDENSNSLPYVDAFELQVVPDISTLLTAYENREVDLVHEVPRNQWGRVQDMENAQNHRVTTGKFPIIEMRVTDPPFDDNRVRTAFKLAVNREQILQAAVSGFGSIANDHPISSSYPETVDIGSQRSGDLERANSLLQEAGYGEGGESIRLTLEGVNQPSYVRNTMVVAAGQLNRLPNVNIQINQQSVDTWYADVWRSATFYISWWSGGITAGTQLRRIWHSDGQFNEAAFSDDEFDAAVDRADSAVDDQTGQEAINTAARILYERGPSIIPIYLDKVATNHQYVHDFSPYPYNRIVRSQNVWLDSGAPTR